jgi:hypothetical protein
MPVPSGSGIFIALARFPLGDNSDLHIAGQFHHLLRDIAP